MKMRQFLSLLSLSIGAIAQGISGLSESSLQKHVDSVTLSHSFNPIISAYWTSYPHHRRTPFAVSPDGKTAYLAYLDSSGTGVHIQQIDPTTFASVGNAVSVSSGKEAGGLVAHDDGFALLTNEVSSSSGTDIPIPVIYRFKNGSQSWKTFIGGPGVDSDGSNASPDINGDLVFSAEAGYYAAYIVVTAYEGGASGHYGDAIRYLDTDGNIKKIDGASSSWGCSHNTGIAFEAADAAPFASICAEDQGAIWLNTKGQGMSTAGVKISNEKVINGASNEPMGGMGGSYSALARFIDQDSYIFSWVSRGAIDLTPNEWMGTGYTKAHNRTNNRNVAIATFSDKFTLDGEEATSVVGAADADSQVNWITQGSNDCSNAHVAAFDGSNALITWEEIENPTCDFEAMGCRGQFAGTFYQLVNNKGEKIGSPVKSTDSFVAGDMVTMADGRICWPYVSMTWDLSGPISGSSTDKISFACMSTGSGSATPSNPDTSSSPISSSAPQQSTSSTAGSSPASVEAETESVAPATSEPTAITSSASNDPEVPSAPVASGPAASSTNSVTAPSTLLTSVRPSPTRKCSRGGRQGRRGGRNSNRH